MEARALLGVIFCRCLDDRPKRVVVNRWEHTHTSIIDPLLGGSMRVAYNDYDNRARLRRYVQFNEYTRTQT